jgi:DNA end-binding protein Ku
MMGMTLRYPYEVRNEAEYFEDIEDEKVPKDMLDLALHIVERKQGDFEPERFEDQYEDAVKELLRKKQKGERSSGRKSRAGPTWSTSWMRFALASKRKAVVPRPVRRGKAKSAPKASARCSCLLPVKRARNRRALRAQARGSGRPANQLTRTAVSAGTLVKDWLRASSSARSIK